MCFKSSGCYLDARLSSDEGKVMPVMRITKSVVEKLPLSEGKPIVHFDDKLTGFGVKVTACAKVYIAQSRVGGKRVRITLGRHGALTAEQAREMAQVALGEMAGGVNPNVEKRVKEYSDKTLWTLYLEFKKVRMADPKKPLRPKTIAVYESALKRCFEDWLEIPASSITKAMVIKRYGEIASMRPAGQDEQKGRRSNKTGAVSQASQAMRVLRTVLNYGLLNLEDADGKPSMPPNPVKKLSQTYKSWDETVAREDVIEPDDLHAWYQAVQKLPNQIMKDYILFCLFTGLRRGAAAKLKWSDVNLQKQKLTVIAENDKTNKSQELPLSDIACEILRSRSEAPRRLNNEYVFPGDEDHSHIQEPKRAIAKVIKDSKGVKFSMHTLRRTFATTAEQLDISFLKVKKLLNHSPGRDITAKHYTQLKVDDLRVSVQLIADELKRNMKISPDTQRTRTETETVSVLRTY
jgi:integrase